MKLGFICLNIPGHLNPMTALALQLQARGDDVVFLYSEGGAGFSVAADIIKQSSGVTKNVGRAHA
jgi:UDP:flavonoid glycosyltransferase YjiC (YdhE family)